MAEKKCMTLCYVCNGDHVLLGLKKQGFGQGRWNGFGGKLQSGESFEQGAKRELQEEVGIIPHELFHRGILFFTLRDRDLEVECHLFTVFDYTGEITESDEMKPEWFPKLNVPFDKMWPADQRWLPYILNGGTIHAYVDMSDPETVISCNIKKI